MPRERSHTLEKMPPHQQQPSACSLYSKPEHAKERRGRESVEWSDENGGAPEVDQIKGLQGLCRTQGGTHPTSYFAPSHLHIADGSIGALIKKPLERERGEGVMTRSCVQPAADPRPSPARRRTPQQRLSDVLLRECGGRSAFCIWSNSKRMCLCTISSSGKRNLDIPLAHCTLP